MSEQHWNTIGPFAHGDLAEIESILSEMGIEYQVLLDANRIEEEEKANAERPPSTHPTYRGLPTFLHIGLSEADQARLGNRLERFGIVAHTEGEPDFNVIDYHCPTCGGWAEKPSLCGKHQVPRVPSEEYHRQLADKESRERASTWTFLKIAAVISAIALAYFRLKG